VFSPSGKVIAVANNLGARRDVVLWDLASRPWLKKDPLPIDQCSGVRLAMSSDGKILAGGYGIFRPGGGVGVVLWDVATGKRLAEDPLTVPAGNVGGVAFSPDNRILAVGYGGLGEASGVVFWDVATGKRLAADPLAVQEGDGAGVAFSPDGKTLVACYGVRRGQGAQSGGMVLWDVETRKRLSGDPLGVKDGVAVDVSFNPDGKSLATVYDPVGVVLWDLDLASWQIKAGKIVNRNFTREEWGQFFTD
jgi:WD40 repeat protein